MEADDKGEEGERGRGGFREKWRGRVANNSVYPPSAIEISDGELCERAESGDVLTVWAISWSAGWVITVNSVSIETTLQRIVE